MQQNARVTAFTGLNSCNSFIASTGVGWGGGGGEGEITPPRLGLRMKFAINSEF